MSSQNIWQIKTFDYTNNTHLYYYTNPQMTERQKELIKKALQKEIDRLIKLSIDEMQNPNTIYDIDRIDEVIAELKVTKELI